MIFDTLFVAVLGLLAVLAFSTLGGAGAVTLVIFVLSVMERHAHRKARRDRR